MTIRTLTLAVLALLIFGSSAFAAPLYADTVEDYSPVGTFEADRLFEDNALGGPTDGPVTGSTVNFTSLGIGGSMVLSFGGQTFSGSATIWETTYLNKDGDRSHYWEYADVYGWLDDGLGLRDTDGDGQYDGVWTLLGSIDNQNLSGSTITFGGTYTYLMIVDTTAESHTPTGVISGDGFDVNAVQVNATPIPGAAWLLGSGLLGLVGLRRRFSA